jgi:CPA2 family monovalent cation:H+ antiporter-2
MHARKPRAGTAVDRRGQLGAGTTLIARGEFSIVVVGLAGAAADPRLGALVAAHVLILATVGPILTRFADDRFPGLFRPGRAPDLTDDRS